MKKIFLIGAIAFEIFNFSLIAKSVVLPIIHIGDMNSEVLKSETKEVTEFDEKLNELIENMKATMENQIGGVGLAATQIGKDSRVFVAKLSSGFQEFINPKILKEDEKKSISIESCMSVPNLVGIVMRPKNVEIKALNKSGKEFILNLNEYDSFIVCHELDHLNKTLFTEIAVDVVDTKELNEEQLQMKVFELLTRIMNKNKSGHLNENIPE